MEDTHSHSAGEMLPGLFLLIFTLYKSLLYQIKLTRKLGGGCVLCLFPAFGRCVLHSKWPRRPKVVLKALPQLSAITSVNLKAILHSFDVAVSCQMHNPLIPRTVKQMMLLLHCFPGSLLRSNLKDKEIFSSKDRTQVKGRSADRGISKSLGKLMWTWLFLASFSAQLNVTCSERSSLTFYLRESHLFMTLRQAKLLK